MTLMILMMVRPWGKNMQLRVQYVAATAVAVSFCLLLFTGACERSEKHVLQREWTANAEFAGDILASKVAAEDGIQLEIREGSELIDPIKAVRSGAADLGVASADRVLRENEGGAELVVIAAATYRSPVVFITNDGLGVDSPGSLRGHTVGIQPGTNTELVFYALAAKNGISISDVEIVHPGWGTQLFETGVVDVLGVFAYDEPVSLGLKGYAIGNWIKPEEHGVHYVGTVYFTRREFIMEHPDIVQSLVNALVEGWKRALAHPDEAISALAERFELVRNNIEKERRSFKEGREYFAGEDGLVLFSSEERWVEMAQSLNELGKLGPFEFDRNVDYRFLKTALAK